MCNPIFPYIDMISIKMKIKKNCPNTDKFYDNMISFPFNHLLANNQIEYLTQSIKQVAKKFK